MIESLLEILVEIGLISADYSHRKKTTANEKSDGNRRTIRKYLFQPTIIILISVFILAFVVKAIFYRYQQNYIHPESTKKELVEIIKAINEWHIRYGTYPANLADITEGRPLRQNWLTDAWNHPYRYSINTDKNSIQVKSAGIDGIFDNSDDIESE